MLNRENSTAIMEKLSNIYGYLDKKDNKEKIHILKTYLVELKEYNCDDILKAIDKLSKTSKFIPSVAEIKVVINEFNSSDYSRANFNSSYWYINLREVCDQNGTPYYDVTKGPDYPLPPFKD